MPRIRKKTSKRQTLHERQKIQHKVREGKKKKAKQAKKNPQWKSKHKKDPGIPSEFPYKEQILAEVAEQRRLAAEERERKKEEKKALKAAQKAGNQKQNESDETNEEEGGEGEERNGKRKLNLDIGSDAVASLSAKIVAADKLQPRNKIAEEMDVDEDEEVPFLVNRDLPNLKAVLNESDVLIEMLDARDPLPYRSRQLEELMTKGNKKVLLVLNKIDMCPRESLASWAAYLRTQHPTLFFRSATAFLPSALDQTAPKGKDKRGSRLSTDDGIGIEAVLKCLGQWAQDKGGDKPLTVGVVGLTNSGKSSFLNTLLRRRALPVYSLTSTSNTSPSTTSLPQEVELGASGYKIRFIDTPGLSWVSAKDDALRPRDILLRSKGRVDRLKDPLPAVTHVVSRANPEDLMVLYNLPAFAKGDSTSFLSGLARSRNLVKKKGVLNVDGACKVVLNDWNTGKFPRYTTAPTTEPIIPTENDVLDSLYERNDAVLATLLTRKEMRKAKGVVKLSPSDIECRDAELEMPYMEEGDESEAEEDQDDIDMEGEDGGSNEDSEGEDGEDSEEDMEVGSKGAMKSSADSEEEEVTDIGEEEYENSVPLTKKQKRKRNGQPVGHQPKKKVAFSLSPRTARQSDKGTALKKGRASLPVALTAKNAKTSSKVANAAGSKRKTKNADGEQAYDFGKYF